MNPVPGLHCVRCRGIAYEEDGALSCMNCGRLLALLPAPAPADSRPYAREWNLKENESLKADVLRRLERQTPGEIAKEQGISKSTIYKWVDRPRANTKFYSAEIRRRCPALMRAGWQNKQIEAETGVKCPTLGQWRREAGLAKPDHDPALKQEILRRIADGEQAKLVAAEAGISKAVVYKWRWEAKRLALEVLKGRPAFEIAGISLSNNGAENRLI